MPRLLVRARATRRRRRRRRRGRGARWRRRRSGRRRFDALKYVGGALGVRSPTAGRSSAAARQGWRGSGDACGGARDAPSAGRRRGAASAEYDDANWARGALAKLDERRASRGGRAAVFGCGARLNATAGSRAHAVPGGAPRRRARHRDARRGEDGDAVGGGQASPARRCAGDRGGDRAAAITRRRMGRRRARRPEAGRRQGGDGAAASARRCGGGRRRSAPRLRQPGSRCR